MTSAEAMFLVAGGGIGVALIFFVLGALADDSNNKEAAHACLALAATSVGIAAISGIKGIILLL